LRDVVHQAIAVHVDEVDARRAHTVVGRGADRDRCADLLRRAVGVGLIDHLPPVGARGDTYLDRRIQCRPQVAEPRIERLLSGKQADAVVVLDTAMGERIGKPIPIEVEEIDLGRGVATARGESAAR